MYDMAEIRKLKDGELTVYPQTVGSAVILDDGTTVQDLADNIDPTVLKTAPSIIKRRIHWDDRSKEESAAQYFEVDHPYIDKPGAEIVLVRYNQRCGKKYDIETETHHNYKKGWSVACGEDSKVGTGCILDKVFYPDDIFDYISDNGIPLGRRFGLALRIPNPEWTRSATVNKNGVYKGVPESLWSDIHKINIHSGTGGTGIGI